MTSVSSVVVDLVPQALGIGSNQRCWLPPQHLRTMDVLAGDVMLGLSKSKCGEPVAWIFTAAADSPAFWQRGELPAVCAVKAECQVQAPASAAAKLAGRLPMFEELKLGSSILVKLADGDDIPEVATVQQQQQPQELLGAQTDEAPLAVHAGAWLHLVCMPGSTLYTGLDSGPVARIEDPQPAAALFQVGWSTSITPAERAAGQPPAGAPQSHNVAPALPGAALLVPPAIPARDGTRGQAPSLESPAPVTLPALDPSVTFESWDATWSHVVAHGRPELGPFIVAMRRVLDDMTDRLLLSHVRPGLVPPGISACAVECDAAELHSLEAALIAAAAAHSAPLHCETIRSPPAAASVMDFRQAARQAVRAIHRAAAHGSGPCIVILRDMHAWNVLTEGSNSSSAAGLLALRGAIARATRAASPLHNVLILLHASAVAELPAALREVAPRELVPAPVTPTLRSHILACAAVRWGCCFTGEPAPEQLGASVVDMSTALAAAGMSSAAGSAASRQHHVLASLAGYSAAELSRLVQLARDHGSIDWDALAAARSSMPPIAAAQVVSSAGSASWDDIGGYAELKLALQQAVLWPLQYAQSYQQLGLAPPRGILLYGPPGCAKTMLVRAAASTSGAHMIALSGADIFSAYVGEAERMLRDTFRRARALAPCLIFIDEIDAIVGSRDGVSTDSGASKGVLTTLLTEMDGMAHAGDVLVVAATNRPQVLDAALLRPGRFEVKLLVPPPDAAGRHAVLQVYTKRMPLGADVDVSALGQAMAWYTGAEIEGVVREAGLQALREWEAAGAGHGHVATIQVCRAHFAQALRTVHALCRGQQPAPPAGASPFGLALPGAADPSQLPPPVQDSNVLSRQLRDLQDFAAGRAGLDAGIRG